ncbi:hypothetical protein [Nitrosomonas oligotropha]|uniref:Uncharacterized protein n=1 Tax=Nitrosomonas oligotropha TaxID=42354 RepID=A0A1H8RN47_9PROT|nr:hypothetical protein [Nitrosomonas oligotropha]SDX02991.1 hypothetical protein SAMN05216300_1165 [Nitrosomonas oligotropha]SEO67393.1 hypothetical protein SAMN05216333_1155 [Nitrosomonas oligotropha]
MELSQKRFNELMTLRSDYNLALQLGGMSLEETERTQLLLDDINAELEEYGLKTSEN